MNVELMWQDEHSPLAVAVREQNKAVLSTYRADHKRISEDANREQQIIEGAYKRRQIYELVQNAVDALTDQDAGRIEIVVQDGVLYVANSGSPFNEGGVHALLASNLSTKRDDSIGRFGLGFKAILAVTSKPRVYSRSGSFEFHPIKARSEIEQAIGRKVLRAPRLRMAYPLQPHAARADDRVLDELMNWAATVVVAPLDFDDVRIKDDVAQFRSEFMVFSPRVKSFVTSVDGERREYTADWEGGQVALHSSGQSAEWMVFQRAHAPSQAALADAGEISGRERVTVKWAVPVSGATGYRLGQFWAHFPTGDATTLSGIVNAPWRLSEDRERVLEGAYNEELLTEVLPALVADSLKLLARRLKPGALIDQLPARGRENRSWADNVLNEPVMRALSAHPSLPDVNGVLRRPSDLQIAPGSSLLSEWAELVQTPSKWVHPECLTRERRSKVERLVERGSTSWEAFIRAVLPREPEYEQLALAIRLAADWCTADIPGKDVPEGLRTLRVLPTLSGLVVPVMPSKFFLPESPDVEGDDDTLIDPKILEFPGVGPALEVLGIRNHNKPMALLSAALAAHDARAWRGVWEAARELKPWDVHVALSKVREAGREVMVRTEKGPWVPANEAYLPGLIIGPVGDKRDANYRIDMSFHELDQAVFEYLGITDGLVTQSRQPDEPWFREWVQRTRGTLAARGKKPTGEGWDEFVNRQQRLWPLASFEHLSVEGRHALTRRIANLGGLKLWTGVVTVPSPYGALVQQHGVVQTSWGPVPARLALWVEDEGQANEWREGFPIAEELDGAAVISDGLHTRPTYSEGEWAHLFELAKTLGDEQRTGFYRWAGWLAVTEKQPVPVPNRIVVAGSAVHPADVLVTESADEADQLRMAGFAVLLVPADDIEGLVNGLGMTNAAGQIDETFRYVSDGEPVALLDEFGKLSLLFPDMPELEDMEIVPCSSIEIEYSTKAGTNSVAQAQAVKGNRLFVTGATDMEQLGQINQLLVLELDDEEREAVIDQRRQPPSAAKVDLARLDTDATRLAAIVPLATLRSQLPREAVRILEAEGRDLDAHGMAHLVLAAEGPEILDKQPIKAAFAAEGIDIPRLDGGAKARQWVAAHGFDPTFAGEPSRTLPATERLPGRIELPDLHDYQKSSKAAIVELISARRGAQRRGMLSLPTGAGKTRVAVESLVESVSHGALSGHAIWIAQTEELCEQAVQTILTVWNASAPAQGLVISRGWGRHEPADQGTAAFHVVVCTYQKLLSLRVKPNNQWMVDPCLVVIDEAHGATASSYTTILEWLSGTTVTRSEVPLVGLSATPFRGTSEEETKRLVNRFGNRRFDVDAFGEGDANRYQFLQGLGVLARVRQQEIVGGEVSLTNQEREEFNRTSWLPKGVERRLAGDNDRTLRVQDTVLGLPNDWPVLLFAPSVENAEVLATLLADKGRPARAITNNTSRVARERAIRQFKDGDLRVLTNYGVLTQGFDAPSVRCVVVARPTSSMNLYQQMIGRGLRGRENGGSEEVLILNVADNIKNYGGELAFSEFERLWGEPAP